ncbi:type III secretion system cytoplasmic ring protein SctQ [Trinickia sp. EG282A]|uniref:type III secretion system cytoplasmic ring protein SctQ n=1 Tax=Trinickia sp. EG282A TaxID=3237013 RepID=UPI0034D357C8
MRTTGYRRLAPRRVDTATLSARRLLRTYWTELALEDGTITRWHLSTDRAQCTAHDPGLPVSTRFGPTIWLDYRALLLALTGIDIDAAPTPSARTAFVRYAVASLPESLFTALGEPLVEGDAHGLPPDAPIVASLRCETKSIRLAMRLLIRADALLALIEHGPWRPAPTTPPAWLIALPSRTRVVAGELTLPATRFSQLRRADVIVLPDSAFDVAGNGRIRIFDRLAEVRWLDDRHCFEVQRMSPEDTPSPPAHHAETAPADAGADMTALPVRLSFSLGALSLPMGEVAAIRAGTVLRLEGALPPSVRIEANGVPLGYGELVDLDGRLAVEIVEWPRVDSGPQSP